ncbi:hypothetical protein ABZ626_36115 [Streptomyces longispororuber]|uniref:hypothetical protein n=1 Tax=Streptomyces TaxID=1883 RepID=UPI0024A87F54|nr:hypothetical protein [Streptomyces sp. CC224B]
MTARRTLFTAATAGALLSALWFVPSAKAAPSPEQRHAVATQAASEDRLADSGGVDTTPYVVGGTASLGLGAGFLAYGVRRERVALR